MRHTSLILLTCGLIAGCQHLEDNSTASSAPGTAALTPIGADGPSPEITTEGKSSVQLAIARLHERNGQTAQAMRVYAEILERSPDCAEALWRLAVLHDLNDSFEESESYFLNAIVQKPDSAALRCDFGYSLYLQNRWDEAETQLKEGLRLDPGHNRTRTNLGLVLARTGHTAAALAEFQQAGCSPAEAHSNVAFADCMRGELNQALENYEAALTIDPQSETASAGKREVVQMLTHASVASTSK